MHLIGIILSVIAITLSAFALRDSTNSELEFVDTDIEGPFRYLDSDLEEIFRIEKKRLITKRTPMEVWLALRCQRTVYCDYCPYPPDPCIKS